MSATAARERTGVDPAELLREDHRRVQALFRDFEKAGDARHRRRLADALLKELKVHAAIEESIFYPAMRQKMETSQSLDAAAAAHDVMRLLIRELEKMVPSDDRFAAKLKVLAENVARHVEEDEARVLPGVDAVGVEWLAVGAMMRQRKGKLLETERGFAAATGGDKPPARRRHAG